MHQSSNSKSTEKLIALAAILDAFPKEKLEKAKSFELTWQSVPTGSENVAVPSFKIEFCS
jgi:hypothetical protein